MYVQRLYHRLFQRGVLNGLYNGAAEQEAWWTNVRSANGSFKITFVVICKRPLTQSILCTEDVRRWRRVFQ
jgi:hypothetical protein